MQSDVDAHEIPYNVAVPGGTARLVQLAPASFVATITPPPFTSSVSSGPPTAKQSDAEGQEIACIRLTAKGPCATAHVAPESTVPSIAPLPMAMQSAVVMQAIVLRDVDTGLVCCDQVTPPSDEAKMTDFT